MLLRALGEPKERLQASENCREHADKADDYLESHDSGLAERREDAGSREGGKNDNWDT